MLKKLIMLTLSALPLVASASDNLTTSGETTMQKITLDTSVGELAANLYLPEGIEKPPVVIVTGAWTTVKEQMPAVYAQALAEEGYAAITFDFRGWGESAGKVKFLEDPQRKTDDIRAAIAATAELSSIDSTRIAGLGICASSGYMLDAVAHNPAIKSAAVVAPWLHDKPMATAIYGGEESAKSLLAAAANARQSTDPVYIEAASLTNESSLMYQVPYYTETDRGLIPAYDNQFNVASWEGWLNYDAQQSAFNQDKPVIMVASEAMALPLGAHQYLDNAGDNVSAVWLDQISQFDFYDQPAAVQQAVSAITQHFEKSL